MRHYILAKFQADAGDWHGYLPRIREIFGAAGEIPGVRGSARSSARRGRFPASAVRRSIPAASTARTGITF